MRKSCAVLKWQLSTRSIFKVSLFLSKINKNSKFSLGIFSPRQSKTTLEKVKKKKYRDGNMSFTFLTDHLRLYCFQLELLTTKNKPTFFNGQEIIELNSSSDLYNHFIRESKGLIDPKSKSNNIIAYG